MSVSWPEGRAEFERWADALRSLLGGRQDVAAIYHDFSGFKGWGPWKGRKVAADYQAADGEVVAEFSTYDRKGVEKRLLQPLSTGNVIEHLRGRQRLGVYVLAADHHCSFLAADFDDHGGQLEPAAVWDEVRQFVSTCETHEWRVHVERSKSGRGYHVWLFFDVPVLAGKARSLGRWLFEESQSLRSDEDFSTFDRFFPAQAAHLPTAKGFGNLIGLPLCGHDEYAKGRTAWLDRQGQLIADPYRYTLGVLEGGRNAATRLDGFLKEWELAPETAAAPAEPRARIEGAKVLAGVPEGARNDTLFKYACSLRSKGLDKAEAEALVLAAAEACQPPMPTEEALTCLRSAWRYQSGKSRGRSANVRAAEVPLPTDVPEFDPEAPPWPSIDGWKIDASGVRDPSNNFICLRPLWVDALTINSFGQWGVSIKYYDLNWTEKAHAFPRERLHEQGGVLARELAAVGLPIVPGKEKWVSRYLVIQGDGVRKRILAAIRLGWYDAPHSPAVFVLPERVLGQNGQEIVFQPDVPSSLADTLHERGELAEWQQHVATPCLGNPILMFSLMLGLAGPLLKWVHEQSGGFHLYGTTTGGKTTAAQVAASVWGCGADPQEGPESTSIRTWHTTGNALEAVAECHNDTLLTLDEIGEVDPQDLGRIIYQLAGGISKGRANASGGLRAMRTWRVLFFSTGEQSVRQMLSGVGQSQKGGQRVRCPDIPADDAQTGARAIVVNSGKEWDAKTYVEALKRACATHYGTAGPAFVSYLIGEAGKFGVHAIRGQLMTELRDLEIALWSDIDEDLPPESRRVLRRFALVAQAGARATLAGILDWKLEAIIGAIRTVRDRWLAEQGAQRSETERGLGCLRDALIAHQDRFRWIGGSERASGRDVLGFRVREYFLVTDTAMQFLSGDWDAKSLIRALKSRDWLWHDAGHLTRRAPRIEGFGDARPRMYWISVQLLGELVAGESDEDAAAPPPANGHGAPPLMPLGPDESMPF